MLEEGKAALAAAWDSEGHTSEFAEELVPFFDGGTRSVDNGL